MEFLQPGFPKDLVAEHSPSLPKDFPRKLLPENICETQFFDLNRCMLSLGNQMTCQKEYTDFLTCKRERDALIYDKIRQWEIKHVKQLTGGMQGMYKQGLTNKLERLKSEIEQLPASFFYQGKHQMDKELYDINAPPEFVKIAPFRFVKPYDHIYKTNAKERWIGKKLIDAMSDEFRAYSREYYVEAITKGKLTINGEIVTIDHIIAPQDRLEHSVFRVEPPVLDLPIEIVHEDRDLLVISKPASMIIHTGGGYHYNCLVGILFYERKPEKLYVLHRLDRLTSGLLLLSKNKRIAESFHDANGTHTVKKIYLARVHGNFPDDIEFNDKPQFCVSQKDAIFSCCSVDQIKEKKAKESKTLFQKLWYDEITDTSLLECSPVTGRTHQIRVHLADLGYPILNDIGYGGKFIGNKIVELNFKGLKQVGIRQQEVEDTGEVIGKKVKLNNEGAGQIEPQKEQQEILANCLAGKEEWDYHKHPLEIYLHSWKYTYKDQQFISQTPHWFEK